MSAVYQPYVSRMSAIPNLPICRLLLYYIIAAFCIVTKISVFGRMSGVCQPYVSRKSAVCLPYIRRMSAVERLYVSRILAVCQRYVHCQPYIRCMSTIPNLPICRLLKVLGNIGDFKAPLWTARIFCINVTYYHGS